jgi:hypothetical protein
MADESSSGITPIAEQELLAKFSAVAAASDSESDQSASLPQPNGGRMDLVENEAQKVFILKGNENSLKGAEQYLRNRGWDVQSSLDLKQALLYVLSNHPKFVFITADHPNRKVRTLPKILSQALPVICVGFAESQSTASMSSLTQMGLEYTLMPPVSGPMIERMVNRIIRDVQKREEDFRSGLDASGKAIGANTKIETVISIKGGNAAAGESGITSIQDATSALRQVLAEESGHVSITQEGGPTGVEGLIQSGALQSKAAQGLASTGAAPSGANFRPRTSSDLTSGPGLSASDLAQRKKAWAGLVAKAKRMAEQKALDRAGINPNASTEVTEDDIKEALASLTAADLPPDLGPEASAEIDDIRSALERNLKKKPSADEGGPGIEGETVDDDFPHFLKKEEEKVSYGEDKESAEKNHRYFTDEAKGLNRGQLGPDEIRIKSGPQVIGSRPETLIEKGAQKALDDTIHLMDTGATSKSEVGAATNVACIIVESSRFSGYLIAAMGEDRKMDKSFVAMIQNRLFTFLKANGEDLDEQEVMDLKIQEVEFQSWAIKEADFLRKSVHEGQEVAMAFFPANKIAPDLQQSKNEKMFQINMADLKDDVAVEFDLYIYLPENDKYLLYTPQGKTFYGNQKQRLVDKGMTQMHLRKESINDVKKYRAQNYLNDKIEAFRKKKAEKA